MKSASNSYPAHPGSGWIEIEGRPAPELEQALELRVAEKIRSGSLAQTDMEFIERVSLRLGRSALRLRPERLDRIRRLCQLWDLELRPADISSHRKIIGPLIVGVKKLLLPILKALLGDTFKRQREFNAEAIQLLTELSGESTEEQS